MRHFLFHRELSDAPGRNESWDEYLRYLGNSRWELTMKGTDFFGLMEAKPLREVMTTTRLLNWVLERDEEIKENPTTSLNDQGNEAYSTTSLDDKQRSTDDDTVSKFGPYAERLREIADSEGASFCVSRLDAWLSGKWPSEKSVRILDIKGVIRRDVWKGVYHCVFDVDTNLGPGYLYLPNADRTAKLVLKSEASSLTSADRIVKVPKRLQSKIAALKPEYDMLRSQ